MLLIDVYAAPFCICSFGPPLMPPIIMLCFYALRMRGLTIIQAVVYSEGVLTMDNCNFSGSTATVLVSAEGPNATTILRNTVLGTSNC